MNSIISLCVEASQDLNLLESQSFPNAELVLMLVWSAIMFSTVLYSSC